MANIMSQLKLENNTSRNAFDVSRKNAFTAKLGELLPVACIECIPGDKIKGRVQHFTRTMPVNTAAYTRMREYYDWFFVPTNLLWNKFNTFVTQMVDNNQHATSINSAQTLTSQHPYFTCNQLATYVAGLKSGENSYNIFNFNRAQLTAKLLHYLGYGDFTASAENGTAQSFRTNANLNPFPLLAYQKIYQDFFRNSQWENAYAPAFNIDYMSGASNGLNIPVSQVASSRTTENMFDLRYCNWNKDLFMGLLPNSQYGVASIINLGTSSITLNPSSAEDYSSILYLQSSSSGTLTPGSDLTAGQVNSSVNANQVLSGTSVSNLYLSSGQLNILRQKLGLSGTVNGSVAASFSILALRQAEALQKWQEITQSQQQDYKNQIEAHFGVSPSDALSERCKYVDGSVSNLDISEVTNTNITGENGADIAGKGVGVGDGSINFSTDVHGYLMCIYHCVPLLDYAIDGIKRTNLKTMATDYAIPEFDKTGMVSVPIVELTNGTDNPTFTAQLLGYAPRYYDYKTAIDEVHGAFYNGTGDLTSWVAPVDTSYITKYIQAMHGSGASLTYQWMKVNPAVLNPIFAQDVDSTVSTDQLLINASFDLTAVRNLDRNGLPY